MNKFHKILENKIVRVEYCRVIHTTVMVNLTRCTSEEAALIKFYKNETTLSIRKIA